MDKLYSNIKFSLNSNVMQHNLTDDYACFALWNSARPFQKEIREYLSDHFEVVFESEVEWSCGNFHKNASRIYETPLFYNEKIPKEKSPYLSKIVDNDFIFYVVKDLNPAYTYARSVSNHIEVSNLNVVKAKYLFRDWIFNRSGYKYGVHSSNNLYEFFYQTPLILGPEIFNDIINGKQVIQQKLQKDVEGAEGWQSWKQVFDILNLSTNYLVLRNYEGLPFENYEKDIDLLTDNYQRVASALGVYQQPNKLYRGYIKVQGQEVPVDIRFVGDKYLDTSWQKDMLSAKVFENGIYIPRKDHFFFSLLFHCKVQKHEVKETYIPVLNHLSEDMNFTWFNEKVLSEDIAASEIINGFFKANGYYYENPVDEGVIKNRKVIKHLIKKNSLGKRQITVKKMIRKFLLFILPYNIYNSLKALLYQKTCSNILYLTGHIVPGRGIGKKVVQSLSSYFLEKNLRLFPGTLNVVFVHPVYLDEAKAVYSYEHKYFFWKVKLNGEDVYAYRWLTCPDHIVEIVSADKLDIDRNYNNHVNIEIHRSLLKKPAWYKLLFWNLAWRGRYDTYYSSDLYVRIINKFESILNIRENRLAPVLHKQAKI